MNLEITSLNINIDGLNGISVPDNINKFISKDIIRPAKKDINYCIIISDIPEIDLEWKQVYKKKDIIVYNKDNTTSALLEARHLIKPYDGKIYAAYIERKFNTAIVDIVVCVRKDCISLLNQDTIFMSLFALERQLIRFNKVIIHCSYIKYKGKAILFSGPSGAGKSTQADLWVRYYGAEVINGDRAVVGVENGKWYAYGWPVCGSSGICINVHTQIEAIVFIKQSDENKVMKLTLSVAAKSLFKEITVNSWNKDFVNAVWNQIEKIIKEVPIFNQYCNISKEAVECLRKHLIN